MAASDNPKSVTTVEKLKTRLSSKKGCAGNITLVTETVTNVSGKLPPITNYINAGRLVHLDSAAAGLGLLKDCTASQCSLCEV